eukprot:1409026-Pyramimonas_sp.AAC.1
MQELPDVILPLFVLSSMSSPPLLLGVGARIPSQCSLCPARTGMVRHRDCPSPNHPSLYEQHVGQVVVPLKCSWTMAQYRILPGVWLCRRFLSVVVLNIVVVGRWVVAYV